MKPIIAFSGRAQSGKDTATNFIIASELKELGVVHKAAKLTPEGLIWITDQYGDTEKAGILKVEHNRELIKESIGVGIYAFADKLKEFCIEVLGLEHKQCYGTDAEKNTLTHLNWEDMPGVFYTAKNPSQKYGTLRNGNKVTFHNTEIMYHEPGPMTGREVLQFFGTDIARKMYSDIWANHTIKQIKQHEDDIRMAIITDCRFPNEVKCIQLHGGKVVRLRRNDHVHTTHKSEKALDAFDLEKYDAVIDNRKMSIAEQNIEIYKLMREWNIMQIKFFDYLLEQKK